MVAIKFPPVNRVAERSWWLRYLIATGFVLVALILNSFPPVQNLPFLFFFGAVALTARVCGFWPALYSTVLSALAADYFFIHPGRHWGFSAIDILRLLLFGLVCLLIARMAQQRSEAQRAAEVNHARLAAIVQSSDDAILSKTLEGIITSWNKGAERLYGYTAAEVIGKHVSLLSPPELPNDIQMIMLKLQKGEQVQQHETTRIRKDGTRIDVLVSVSPVHDAAGNVVGASTTARDITSQKIAAEELARERAKAELANKQRAEILLSIAEGLIVLDEDWNIVHVNQKGAELARRSPETILGRNLWQIFPELVGSRFEEAFRRVRAEQTVARLEAFYPPFDSWFQVNVYPSGNGISLFFQDITPRKKAEEALRDSERRLQFAQRAANIGSWEWNIKTDGLWWSDGIAPLHGYKTQALQPSFENWINLVFPEDREKVQDSIQRAVEQRGDYELEYRTQWPDGSLHWIVARGQVLSDEKGNAEKMIGIGIDVTERKAAEETLRKTEKLAATGRLAASIAHEINNPLEAVTNLLYLLRKNPSLDEKGRNHLAFAEQELERVAHISKQTLGFYRQVSSPSRVDVAKTLENVLSVYTHKLEGQGIKVEKRWKSETQIQALAGEIRQVFSNLIANSLYAMPQGGTLTLKVSKSHDWGNGNRRGVRVVIADTGTGISAAQQRKLFEPFFTTKRDVGTGLGLWVSKSIVEKHAGFIQVRSSVRPGKSGTVFSVFLPESEPASIAA